MRVALCCLLLSAVGCTGRTEIIVGVATDLKAKGQLDTVQFVASRNGTPIVMPPPWTLADVPAGQFTLPGSFGIYSQDGSEPRVELSVKGFLGSTLVAERDSIVSLVSGKTLFMRLGIVGDCGQLSTPTCASGETCVEGVCRAVGADSHRFPTYKKELVDHVECDSGTHFIDSSTGDAMLTLGTGSCEADEFCQEGTCYKLLKGEDGALQQGIWVQQTTPTTYALRAMWGTADGADVFSVGDHGTILHLTGGGPAAASGWALETSGITTALYAISGTGASDVWAAGEGGILLHRSAAGTWSAVASGITARIDSLIALAPDSVWAIGRKDDMTAFALHFDGANWTAVTLPKSATDLRSVFASGDSDVYAVGHGSNAFHDDGTGFTKLTAPAMQDYSAVAGGAGKIFIVGLGGLIVHGDFTAENSPTSADLFGVWVSPAGDEVYAVGDFGTIAHLKGGTWTIEPSGTQVPLRAVWGAANGDLYAIGTDGVVVHNTGTAASCTGPADCPNLCATGQLTVRSCVSGTCVAASPAPCTDNYACADATHCLGTCAADTDCQDGFYCDPNGSCRVSMGPGNYCDDSATECKTAGCRVCITGLFCTNHICCDSSPTACSGCMECKAPTGTCGPVAYGEDRGGFCEAKAGGCNAPFCNGAGGCGNTGNSCGTVCDPNDTEAIDTADCHNGACVTPPPSPCPSVAACAQPNLQWCGGSGVVQGKSCATDFDCNPGTYCDAHFLCQPQKTKGAPCNPQSPLHCASEASPNPVPSFGPVPIPCAECAGGLSCVDGVCCDSQCTGQCQACDLPGKVGTCSPVTGEPHRDPQASPSPRPACAGSGACAGFCDGVSPTLCTGSIAVCTLAACDPANNYTLKQDATCTAGACPAQTSKSCEPYACVNAACRTSCKSNSDCASTKPTCDLNSGVCH